MVVTRQSEGVDVPAGEMSREVLESLIEGCQVIDREWRYVYLNDIVASHARRRTSELLGRTMMECFPGIESTPMFIVLRRSMIERTHHRLENEFAYPDGSRGWFELRFVPVPDGVCVLSLDITEAKRAAAALSKSEEQLRQAQKLEAIGQLAGGIAHDFNNILSVVLGYSALILSELKPEEPLRAEIDEIHKAGMRAAELTQQLLAFSRQQVLELKVLNLNQIVAANERMLRRLLGADVDLTVLPASGLWSVRADRGQIEQVILNLAINARDAMPSGGKLTIETENVELDGDYARAHHGVRPGQYVVLAISDTGIGMDRETQARIFDPFFTTKGLGKGTGLGLATVFGIVKQTGGHIWVYSEPDAGAVFKVYLPRAESPDHEVSSERPLPLASRAGETILLVEDDEHVRGVARGILRRAGYVVLEAPNGGEALLICESHTANIDLLLTDVVLPRMSGRQLAERLAPLRPSMKVLFMSGYTNDAVLQHGVLNSDVQYLQKPFTPDSLARKVREVLDSDDARS